MGFFWQNDISIHVNGVENLLKNINPHKAKGPDEIHGRVLKECRTNIAPILAIIFEKSLTSGSIPSDWKHANVCPVYKKGDKHEPKNYRPISLTCICCKLCEHIIASSLMQHLENSNILYDFQHGFRSSRSWETQLISFIQDLARSADNNTQTDIIIMDFAKAFDKVSHRHLLYKLNYYGVNNNAFHWIADFLDQRSQTVVLEAETSDTIPVTSGVPQGTVLGSILFLIYINDFPEYLTHSTLRLFADDCIIYKEIHSESDARNLQQDLEAAARWEQDWLMCFHPDKCNVLSITQKQKSIKFTYKLHGHSLEKTDSTKYLGITLQSNLKWDKHINNITSKANQTLGFLRRNLKVNSQKIKDHAYKALVRPKLEYSSCVWDPPTTNQINQLEKVQRRAARFVCGRFHNTSSVTKMLEDLDWPLLQVRRLRTRLIMFYKIIHHQIAIYPSDLLIPVDTRTRHSNPNCYRQIQTSKDIYRFSFYPQTILQWNQLPSSVVTVDTVECFRNTLTVPVLIPILN